jgi:DNA invertase Pin-like site-specific DNA recombinase
MKVAIYVRVSRKDQDYHRQINDLQTVADAKGYTVIETIKEKVSGSKRDRDGIKRLLELGESKTICKVLVTEVSRLGRKTVDVLKMVEMLTELGVSIYVHNFGIETIQANGRRNPMVSMMFTMLAEFASMEREFLIDRTVSGLERAKKNGRVLGRPIGTTKDKEQLRDEYKPVIRTLKQGISIRKTAKIHALSINTVRRVSQLG